MTSHDTDDRCEMVLDGFGVFSFFSEISTDSAELKHPSNTNEAPSFQSPHHAKVRRTVDVEPIQKLFLKSEFHHLNSLGKCIGFFVG